MDQRLTFIFRRRSIRHYRDKPVSKKDIIALLEAGMAAPSANDKKPWHFVVITDREKLDGLAKIHPYAEMLTEATLCIAVCGDLKISSRYWVQDCSAATENILIAAANIGLGAVWLGCHPRIERKKLLKDFLRIPEDIELLSLIAAGHPAEKKEIRTQHDMRKIHWENW
ncbi:nitroreductase family protein [candidate division WOR-3 bacterium]|nr:nitroreductase family protein [candidate division WOR-3 bacterium]